MHQMFCCGSSQIKFMTVNNGQVIKCLYNMTIVCTCLSFMFSVFLTIDGYGYAVWNLV